MAPKKVTIVIVTHNGRSYLPDCLESVFRQDYPRSLVKVVVVDNNSSDSTVGYLKEKYSDRIELLENQENQGFAKANNQGYLLAKKNRADYLVLLNQDTVVEENWLRRLVETAKTSRQIAAVQPKLLLYPEKDKINSFGNTIHFLGFAFCNRYRWKNQQPEREPFPVPYPSGAACLLKISALDKVGLFDPELFVYHEDVDLGWRLRLAGYQVVFDPLAVVCHKYRYSKAKYKFYYMERNRLIVFLKNYRIATMILFLPAFLVMELGLLFFSLKNGWFWEKVKGFGWFFLHWPSVLDSRFDVQFRIRKISDREILKLFGGSIKFQEVDCRLLRWLVNPMMELYFRVIRKIIFW